MKEPSSIFCGKSREGKSYKSQTLKKSNLIKLQKNNLIQTNNKQIKPTSKLINQLK